MSNAGIIASAVRKKIEDVDSRAVRMTRLFNNANGVANSPIYQALLLNIGLLNFLSTNLRKYDAYLEGQLDLMTKQIQSLLNQIESNLNEIERQLGTHQ